MSNKLNVHYLSEHISFLEVQEVLVRVAVNTTQLIDLLHSMSCLFTSLTHTCTLMETFTFHVSRKSLCTYDHAKYLFFL